MKRLLIEKLIVISDIEQKSREINFSKGLNIIIGENKTGKSSLIKSIFHSLGCEVKMETSWKKIVDWYLLYFMYGDIRYCVLRQGKSFRILRFDECNDFHLLIFTEHFHEYSNYLMTEIFGVSVECLTMYEEVVNMTPPLLFRFQYIDQDKGWNKIGEGFTNMKYILNWKDYTNKYVVGYQGEEFYKTKKEINLLKNKIDKLNVKIFHFKELVAHLKSSTIDEDEGETQDKLESDLKVAQELLTKINYIEKERVRLQEKLSQLRNERYEKTLALELIKKNIDELTRDHDFAIVEEEVILCPFCGTEHSNTLEERVEIVKDIQTGNQLVRLNRDDVKKLEEQISKYESEYKFINQEFTILKKKLENTKNGASVANTYRSEGKREIINTSVRQSEKIKTLLNQEIILKIEKEKYLEGLKSEVKRKQIYEQLKRHYSIVLNKLNIPISHMRFNNFVQTLDNTGSELPRIIYSYHIALYLYNLEKGESVFNWLVVDTPNQQGQDDKNLKNIDSILELVLTKQGQFIIGTERETGFENQASRLIKLTEYKSSLLKATYNDHKNLINKYINL